MAFLRRGDGAGFGGAPECRRRYRLLGRDRVGIRLLGRLRDVGTVLELHSQFEALVGTQNADSAAVKLDLVAVGEAPACGQGIAVDRDRIVAAHGLHERLTVQQVEQDDGSTTGPGQADRAIAARADAQRQLPGIDSTFALYIPDKKMVETQIRSSQRTTTGCMSISGATRNSRRTSRNPGRLPTAT